MFQFTSCVFRGRRYHEGRVEGAVDFILWRLAEKFPRFKISGTFRGLKPRKFTNESRNWKDATNDEMFWTDVVTVFRDKLFLKGRHTRDQRNQVWWKYLEADEPFRKWFKVILNFLIKTDGDDQFEKV